MKKVKHISNQSPRWEEEKEAEEMFGEIMAKNLQNKRKTIIKITSSRMNE